MKIQRLLQTIGLFMSRGAAARGKYLRDKHIFACVGENVCYQPRLVPLYPELIKLHNNIMIAAGVRFVTHDASYTVLNRIGCGKFPEKIGCIEIMDNVFVGYNVTIMNNVKIGENVIVGANTIITKDLDSNGVYVGSPAKRISSFDDYVKKMSPNSDGEYTYPYVKLNQRITKQEIENAWKMFEEKREKSIE